MNEFIIELVSSLDAAQNEGGPRIVVYIDHHELQQQSQPECCNDSKTTRGLKLPAQF